MEKGFLPLRIRINSASKTRKAPVSHNLSPPPVMERNSDIFSEKSDKGETSTPRYDNTPRRTNTAPTIKMERERIKENFPFFMLSSKN